MPTWSATPSATAWWASSDDGAWALVRSHGHGSPRCLAFALPPGDGRRRSLGVSAPSRSLSPPDPTGLVGRSGTGQRRRFRGGEASAGHCHPTLEEVGRRAWPWRATSTGTGTWEAGEPKLGCGVPAPNQVPRQALLGDGSRWGRGAEQGLGLLRLYRGRGVSGERRSAPGLFASGMGRLTEGRSRCQNAPVPPGARTGGGGRPPPSEGPLTGLVRPPG